jgi:hypothetical protein
VQAARKTPSPFLAPAAAAAELGADQLRRGVGDVDMGGGAAGAAAAKRAAEDKAKARRSRLLRSLKRAGGLTPSAESVVALLNEQQEANLSRYTPERHTRISSTPLHIGDIVCLRCPHHQGFLHAEGFVDNLCGMLPEPRAVHQVGRRPHARD